MKMKQIGAVVIGMLLVSETLAQERERTPPKVEQVKSITLKTKPSRWVGVFYSNGAAKLEWYGGTGSSGLDNTDAFAPRGSFSFKEVYNLLVPRLQQDGDGKTTMLVHIDNTSQETFFGGYLEQTEENKKIVRKLMNRLCNKVVPGHKETFERLLREYPLLSGDMPVSRVYKEDPNQTAFLIAHNDTIDWDRIKEGIRRSVKERREETGMPDALTEEEERAVAKELAQWRGYYGLPPEMAEDDSGGTPSPANRPWLYVGILSALCAGAVLWLIRRKRR